MPLDKKDVLDQTHSLYVDQWDWELVMDVKNKHIEFLEGVVKEKLWRF